MFEVEQNLDRRHDPAIRHYLSTISIHPLLDRHQEAALARRIRRGDREALDALVQANLRFVVSVAKRFLGRGLSFMDLIAEGNVGLITAARRYDERRDLRFVTYAVWWIRQSIQTALQDHTRTVRLPANRVRQLGRLARQERTLEQQRMGTVAEDELAESLNLAPDKLRQIRAATSPNLGLDLPLGEGGATLADTLEDPRAQAALETDSSEDLQGALDRALEPLDDRERDIIRRYYGLDRTEAMSLAEIGQSVNLSRERVRQIRERAFAKIRHGEQARLLAEYLD